MTRRLATTTVIFLLIAMCVALCGCGADLEPFSEREIPNGAGPTVYTLYVCGAVQNEGFYRAEAGTAYDEVLQSAGLLEQSFLPTLSSAVDRSVTQIIIDYFDGAKRCSSVNVNGILIVTRQPIDGIPQEAVDKLADYIDEYGTIHNKSQLKIALGELYAQHFYKFFVAKEDYEEAD